MKKYKCTDCHYIYDEVKGDSWSGIKPGTRFKELPMDWTCPVCMHEKELFVEYTDEEFLKNFFKGIERLKAGQTQLS